MSGRAPLSRLLIILAMGWLAVSGASAKGVDHAASPYGPAMRVVIVRSADATCGVHCPEWISAEGAVTKDVPAAFHQLFKQLGTVKLPILMHSNGGDIASAIRIAREIRRHHLDVVVARTWFESCGAGSTTCPSESAAKGLPFAYSAICASACSFVLAGGEHRYVPALNRIGVHQPHRVIDAKTGSPAQILRQALQSRDLRLLRDEMTEFFVSMGIADHIVDLSMETPPSDIRWLTRGQLLDLKLVTNLTGGDDLIATLRPKADIALGQNVRSVKLPPPAYRIGSPNATSPGQETVAAAEKSMNVHMLSPSTIEPAAMPGFTPSDPLTVPPPTIEPSSPPPRSEHVSTAEVAINDVYGLHVSFKEAEGGRVFVTAEIERLGVVQVARIYDLLLDSSDRGTFEIVASPTTWGETQLHGMMMLRDYCALAKSEVHLRLFVPSTIGRRETTGVTRRILTDADVWPDCQLLTSPSASATH